MELLLSLDVWASFLTLAALEIVLGIDNLIFLAIVTARLPERHQAFARRLGLLLALGLRIVLLLAIWWIVGLTAPILTVGDFAFSWRDLVLLVGGLFLLVKATLEIHHTVEGEEEHGAARQPTSMLAAVVQIALIDVVFALDSIITAVGMAEHVEVMIAAVVVAMVVMMVAAEPVSRFVLAHPTVKMLALAFLLLVGVLLVADAFQLHVPRGYLYFAIFFSGLVEGLNQLARYRRQRRSDAATAEPAVDGDPRPRDADGPERTAEGTEPGDPTG